MPGIKQFDTSETIISGKNIAEAVSYDQPIYFNESYVVIGDIKAPRVYGSYDLVILGDLAADEIEIKGELTVTGKIHTKVLTVEKSLVCKGKIDSGEIVVSGNLQAESIYCEILHCFGNVVVQTIADIKKEMEMQNAFVALEGIIGQGSMSSSKIVTGEYFEFEGKIAGRVIDLGEEDNSKGDLEKSYIEEFRNKISDELQKTGDMDEEYLKRSVHEIAELDCSHWCEWGDLIDRIIDLSYENNIQNFRDYLLVLYANRIFPKEVTSYETLAHVFEEMLKEAGVKCSDMNYIAQNVEELSQSIKIIVYCEELLAIDKKAALDKVFQSVGIKYGTVERFLGSN